MFKTKFKGVIPDATQRMLILKNDMDPYVWNVFRDEKDIIILRNRLTLEFAKIEK